MSNDPASPNGRQAGPRLQIVTDAKLTDLLWILDVDGRTPIPIADTVVWAQWLGQAREEGRTQVGKDQINPDVEVSTIFLGINHSWRPGPPVVFETIVFRRDHDVECWRYRTWDEAADQHARVVRWLRGGPRPS